MKLNTIPLVRLEIDRMKQSIVAALYDYNDEIGKAVEVEIESAVNEFDLAPIVRTQVHEAIERAVVNFFGYGGNGYKAIQESVAAVLGQEETP